MARITKNPRFNCYFGCDEGGPLHHFPKPHSDLERFDVWKGVLDIETKAKGNEYIYNQLRISDKHFENCYKSPSRILIRNADPTLYVKDGTFSSPQEEMTPLVSTELSSLSAPGTASLMLKIVSVPAVLKNPLKRKLNTVQAGKMECFFQKVLVNEIIDIEYQVIDSSHGDLDISFQLSDPLGRSIVGDYKKPDNAHRHTVLVEGDYRLCFDNTFSTFSEKTVFFDLMIDSEDPEVKDYDDDKELELGGSAETYMMKVKDISESVTKLRDNVSTARRLQELLSAHEARDRNLAEDMCDRVLKWSLGQIILMTIVGVTQVYFLKSLFEDPSNRSFKKMVPNFMSQ